MPHAPGTGTEGRDGTCRECGYSWTLDAPEIQQAVAAAPARFRDLLDATRSDPGAARRRAAPGTWSAVEYAGHVADVVVWYHERIVTVLDAPGTLLAARDWDAVTEQRRYRDRSTEALLAGIGDACRSLQDTLAALRPQEWDTAGTGSGGGRRSVLDLSRRVVHELVHHHLDVQRSLRTAGAAAPDP